VSEAKEEGRIKKEEGRGEEPGARRWRDGEKGKRRTSNVELEEGQAAG
jgi:hypothetical protein